MEKLKWETKKVKVKDLIQLDINPRKITEEKKQKLVESLEKFNLAEIPAVNTDMTIIGGNQRVSALMLLERGEEEIDVRMPNRKLSKKEVKEYAIISNIHAGEWDFEILDLEFTDIEIESLDLSIPMIFDSIEKTKTEPRVGKNIKEKTTSHILITYQKPTQKEVNIIIDELKKIEGVEIEHSTT